MTKRPGYTLIELLIVVVILGVLFGIGINAIIQSQATFIFNGAIQQVQSMVREARSLAVTGKSVVDHTDYDEDGDPGDFVTPAHYGVHFDAATRTMTLFADLQPGLAVPGYSGTIGVFDPPSVGIGEYDPNDDSDIMISTYVVPDSLDLLVTAGTTTVLYTPIFADTAFADDTVPVNIIDDLSETFFVFGLRENAGDRELCYGIHPVSGVPETSDATDENCP